MSRTNSSNWSVNDAITAARLQDFNEDLDDLYSLGTDRARVRMAVSGTPLRIDISAFAWRIGSNHGQYAGATDIVVTNTATNYVEMTAAGAIAINTTGWTTAYARLATVTCSGGVVTAISPWTPDLLGGEIGGSSPSVSDKTSDYPVTSGDIAKFFTNNGAGGTVNFTLPAPAATYFFTFAVYTAQTLKVLTNTPASEFIYFGKLKCNAIATNAITSVMEVIYLSSTRWAVRSLVGLWKPIINIYTIVNSYFMGGYTGAGAESNVIRKLVQSSDTASSLAATLDTARHGGCGVYSSAAGYCMGGDTGAASAVISKLTYSGETEANLAATLDTARGFMDGGGSMTLDEGYASGGLAAATVRTIDNMNFAADTSTQIFEGLTAATGKFATIQESGYRALFLGGEAPASTRIASVGEFLFHNETVRIIATTLSAGRADFAGSVFNMTNGWTAGGYDGGYLGTISKFVFSTNVLTNLAATLDDVRRNPTGSNGNTKGYWAGGRDGSASFNEIDDLTMAADTSAELAAVLSTDIGISTGVSGT